MDLPELTGTDVERGAVLSTVGDTMTDKVFQRGRDAIRTVLTLQPRDVAAGHGCDEQRIFAERFLHAPPPEVACHVEHR